MAGETPAEREVCLCVCVGGYRFTLVDVELCQRPIVYVFCAGLLSIEASISPNVDMEARAAL